MSLAISFGTEYSAQHLPCRLPDGVGHCVYFDLSYFLSSIFEFGVGVPGICIGYKIIPHEPNTFFFFFWCVLVPGLLTSPLLLVSFYVDLISFEWQNQSSSTQIHKTGFQNCSFMSFGKILVILKYFGGGGGGDMDIEAMMHVWSIPLLSGLTMPPFTSLGPRGCVLPFFLGLWVGQRERGREKGSWVLPKSPNTFSTDRPAHCQRILQKKECWNRFFINSTRWCLC